MFTEKFHRFCGSRGAISQNSQPNINWATTYVINVSTDKTYSRILKIADLIWDL